MLILQSLLCLKYASISSLLFDGVLFLLSILFLLKLLLVMHLFAKPSLLFLDEIVDVILRVNLLGKKSSVVVSLKSSVFLGFLHDFIHL